MVIAVTKKELFLVVGISKMATLLYYGYRMGGVSQLLFFLFLTLHHPLRLQPAGEVIEPGRDNAGAPTNAQFKNIKFLFSEGK
jgi:hypothetical protein